MVNYKRGQFYLIAALVIIVLIIGFAAITNYSRTHRYSYTYDLGEELKIESAQVLDFGIYNENIGIDQMRNLLEGFIAAYSEQGEIGELYFIFGNALQIVFMGYQQLEEELLIEVGFNEGELNPLYLGEQEVLHGTFSEEGFIETITVKINYIDGNDEYDFTLKPGENFYFILSQVIGGEKYVEQGGN